MPTTHDAVSRRFAASCYPTPVVRLAVPCAAGSQLWLKNDGLINTRYGGNKVRKLERILPAALAAGARRIVTLGAAGSHHVLATTLFGRELGLEVCAALFPQPWSPHAEHTLASALAHGLSPIAARSLPHALWIARRRREPGDYYVPAGGASAAGVAGYVAAMRELALQIAAGELPEPELIVAPLGTGGTVAGLSAGAVLERLGTRVIGVEVAAARGLTRPLVIALARRASSAPLAQLHARLGVDSSHSGRGYGHQTERAARAQRVAAEHGLRLDPTYTAKAFAKALELVGHPDFAAATPLPRRVLYWHTLSCAEPNSSGRAPGGLQGLETLLRR